MNFREFFYFQKSDRQVLLVALAVAVLAFCLIFFLGGNRQSASLSENDSVVTKPSVSEQNTEEYYYAVKTEESELFEFDPNTADSTQLLALGLQPWQVRNIYKYRAKGGIYRTPEDFARVYGLTVGQYRRLAPISALAKTTVRQQMSMVGGSIDMAVITAAMITEAHMTGIPGAATMAIVAIPWSILATR